MTSKSNKKCKLKLALGLVLALAAGVLVSIIGFILTLVYLFTTRHLHAAAPPHLAIYLVAPAVGLLVTLTAATLTLRNWLRARRGPGRPGREETMT